MIEQTERVVLVTGSSSGIGAALCRRLAAPGVRLAVHARHNREGVEEVCAEVRAQGGEAVALLGDLTEPDTAAHLVEATVAAFGGLDALVANAGIPVMSSLSSGTREEFDHAIGLNLTSVYDLIRAARPHLQDRKAARIVAVGSFTAHVFRVDLKTFPVSAPSKAGVEALVGAAAIELAPEGITVNCVAPGLIRKDRPTGDGVENPEIRAIIDKIPLGRQGLPDEIAAAIQFLLSPDASYITGQTIHVNGGLI